MAHIPSDDVRQLYSENRQQSWSSLHQILEQHKGKAEGIEDSVVNELLIISQRMDQSHAPYPPSEDQFQRVLDSELSRITA